MTQPDLRGPAPSGPKALLVEDVTTLVIHRAKGFKASAGLTEVDRAHRLEGRLSCGYHYVIRKDGTLEPGRPLRQRGHLAPELNSNTVGVLLMGPDESPAQERTLVALIKSLAEAFPGLTTVVRL